MVHRLHAVGVLLTSAILSTLGLYLLSTATGGMVYVAIVVSALGVLAIPAEHDRVHQRAPALKTWARSACR
jgi:hypothetical protein